MPSLPAEQLHNRYVECVGDLHEHLNAGIRFTELDPLQRVVVDSRQFLAYEALVHSSHLSHRSDQ